MLALLLLSNSFLKLAAHRTGSTSLAKMKLSREESEINRSTGEISVDEAASTLTVCCSRVSKWPRKLPVCCKDYLIT